MVGGLTENGAQIQELLAEILENITSLESCTGGFQKNRPSVLMAFPLPFNSLQVFVFLVISEPTRTMSRFIDGKVLQLDAFDRAVRAIDIDGEIRAILAIICIDSIEFVLLFISEFDPSGTEEIADLAFFV